MKYIKGLILQDYKNRYSDITSADWISSDSAWAKKLGVYKVVNPHSMQRFKIIYSRLDYNPGCFKVQDFNNGKLILGKYHVFSEFGAEKNKKNGDKYWKQGDRTFVLRNNKKKIEPVLELTYDASTGKFSISNYTDTEYNELKVEILLECDQ